MGNNGDATAATGLTLTDALKGAGCLACTNNSASFWKNTATITTAADENDNGMNPKHAVVPLAATYPSYYYRPSCAKLALGGVVSGVVMGGAYGAAAGIGSSGMDGRMVLGSTARTAMLFGTWVGTFRGTKCVFARSGIPGTDGVPGATAAGATTGAFVALALNGFNMQKAGPKLGRFAAGSALLAGVFELIYSL